ncbi:unnamed protein product [Rotaria sp. Silwood1]|nr:unnamed protein product [Rotaria sp. Silwood1]
MDTEIIIDDENNQENLITTTSILQSVENKTMEATIDASEKTKKDPTKVVCIACNEQFSIHHGGKNDIDQHTKSKKHINSMKSFSVNRQLITSMIKPNKEGEETAVAEGIIDLVEDADESAANIYENLKAAIKKAGLHLEAILMWKVFVCSEMKHLLNDFRNRVTSDSVAAELQIRRNDS